MLAPALSPSPADGAARLATATTPSGANPTRAQAQAREKAEEFEAVFLTMVVEQMFSGLDTEAPFGGGHAEEQYRSMMAREYAGNIVRAGGIGVADHVYNQLLKLQEVPAQ